MSDLDYMCPNCVTPWKCNGPHIPDPGNRAKETPMSNAMTLHTQPLCGAILATCQNEPEHPGDHWNSALAIECPICASGDVEHARAKPLDLPPRIVVDARGFYWRDYGDYYSMCPVNDDNEPVKPAAAYLPDAPLRSDPKVDWDAVEYLVDDAIRREVISAGRGAEILGITLRTWRDRALEIRDEPDPLKDELARLRAAAPAEAREEGPDAD